MPLNIVKKNLTDISADAIVYADTQKPFSLFNFNPLLLHETGKEFIKSREKVNPVTPGEAKIIPASLLDAKYIIHTSAPIWHGGLYHELAHLHACYDKSLQIAVKHECKSVALPIIATDGLGYSKSLSQKTAFERIQHFLLDHDMDVYLVVPKVFGIQLPGNRYSAIDKFLTKNYIEGKEEKEAELQSGNASTPLIQASLKDFSEALQELMNRKNMTESDIQHKANLSASKLTEILCMNACLPAKNTVIALGMALELTLEEMKDFIKYAGYELTHDSKFDLIIEYCISQNIYDVAEINQILFRFDQELLG